MSVRFINATLRRSKRRVARVDERLDAALIVATQDAEETWMPVRDARAIE